MLVAAAMSAILLPLPQMQAERAVPTTAEGIFLEAVKHWGMSTTDAVLVTVIDKKTKADNMVCVAAQTLAFAVAAEHGLKASHETYQEITYYMTASRDRRFTFSNPAALAAFEKGLNGPDFDRELCSYIRKGVYAFRGDRPAIVYVGQVYN